MAFIALVGVLYSTGIHLLFHDVNDQLMQCNKRELGKVNKEHRLMNREFGWLFSCFSVFGIFPGLIHGF